jgi:hypothetical protein
VGRNKREDTHISQFSISKKKRYDVLSNLSDYSLIGDELSLETDQVSLRKKVNCHHDIETFQNRQNIKDHGSRPPRKVNNQHVSEHMIAVDNSSEPKKIPIIMNGCVSETRTSSADPKNRELYTSQNSFSDLYTKLLDKKTSFPKCFKHKVLSIGGNHLRGYSENIKIYLNDQFQVSGFY